MFIAIGLALYSLRRIRIMRAIGTLKSDDSLRAVLKRVNSLTLEFKEEKMSINGSSRDGGSFMDINRTNTDEPSF
jgi:hypothetical protein